MTLKDCLTKFKNEFKDLPNLEYYIDSAVIPYSENGGEWYHEIMKIVSKDVFTLRCVVGCVYCLIEYCEDTFGATFRNEATKEEVFFQNKMGYNAGEVNRKLFDIFD